MANYPCHQSKMRLVPAVLMTVCLGGAGCSPSEGVSKRHRDSATEVVRTPILAHLPGGPESIHAPDTVQSGQPFGVAFTTSGNSCIEKGTPRVRAWHLRAVITAYDLAIETPPVTVCQDYEETFDHVVQVQFPSPGLSVLEVHGYDSRMRPVVYSREILVR